MTRHAARLLALAAAVGCAGAVAAQAPFRGSVDLVSLNVTVTEAGHYVTNLEEADFEVFEDGIKQQTTFFSKEQQPIALAILLDTSASMDNKLETAQEAAVGFARRMQPRSSISTAGSASRRRSPATGRNWSRRSARRPRAARRRSTTPSTFRSRT